MQYLKAIRFKDFILFSKETTDIELMEFERHHTPFLVGSNSNINIRYDNKFYYLYEWTEYSVVGTSSPLTTMDYFYDGKLGRHNFASLFFKNFVGLIRFRKQIFQIESKKMTTENIHRLVREIDTRIKSTISLRFSEQAVSKGDFGRTSERFRNYYLYIKLFNSLEKDMIFPFIHFILSQPNNQFDKTMETRSLSTIQNISTESIIDVFSGNSTFFKDSNNNRISKHFKGYIPLSMNEYVTTITVNTSENQFIKYFLVFCLSVLNQFWEEINANDSKSNHLLVEKIEGHRDNIQKLLRKPFFQNITSFTSINNSSTILTRRYGYRQIYHEFITLKQTPINCFNTNSLIELYENKSVDKLYEYICLFRLVDTIETLYENSCNITINISKSKLYTVSLSETNGGVEFIFKGNSIVPDSRLLFQHSFTKRANTSKSVEFKPDFTWQICTKKGIKNYHFDSKFKFSNNETVKNEDISKMHSYRDGIVDSIGAFVLFPGFDEVLFTINAEFPYQGVGAFPVNIDSISNTSLQRMIEIILNTV